MMKNLTEVNFCIQCQSSIVSCFCACPYCGKVINNCDCNDIGDNNKKPEINHNSRHDSFDEIENQIFSNKDDEEWKRLEKWHLVEQIFLD